jgi:predicted nucleotidyltransferase
MMMRLGVALTTHGIHIERMVLFGSYAKGNPHKASDIDIAVWSNDFSGYRLLDIEKCASVISKFPDLQLHPFAMDDTAINNPLVEEIEKTGIDYTGLIADSISR